MYILSSLISDEGSQIGLGKHAPLMACPVPDLHIAQCARGDVTVEGFHGAAQL